MGKSLANVLAHGRSIIVWLLYIGLSAASFIFVKQSFADFLEKKTSFYVTTTSMTAADMPTMTICLETRNVTKYGTDLTLSTMYNDTQWTTLNTGANGFTDRDGYAFTLVLVDLAVYQLKTWVKRNCIKISFVELSDNDTIPNIRFELEFQSSNASNEISLYFTSEENAYGAVFEKWYDGKIKPYKLKSGKYHDIRITEMKECKHLLSLCDNQSYYQCLARKLVDDSTCRNPRCSKISLPTEKNFSELEKCKNTEDADCQYEFFSELLVTDVCKSHTVKACTLKEYYAQDGIEPYKVDNLNGYMFDVTVTSPESSRVRVSNPIKQVFKEYFQPDVFDMIGTVGGTLGLMIGFSFMSCITWISDTIFLLGSRFKTDS